MKPFHLNSFKQEHRKEDGYKRALISCGLKSTDLREEIYYSFDSPLLIDGYFINYDEFKDTEREEVNQELNNIDLLIIIVNKDYFSHYLINEIEFEYAKEHKIPILPIIIEEDCYSLANEYFGNIQVIKKDGVEYHTILNEHLSKTLFGDSSYDIDEIKSVFHESCFISYRKSDKEELKSLLFNIRQDEELRPYQFWYDDFLNPGNNYDKEILEAMNACKIFILLVTKNTLEKDNYVLKIEYPYAVKHQKTILVIYDKDMDFKLVSDWFPDGTEYFQNDEIELINEFLKDNLSDNYSNDGYKSFLLGQAYYHGLVVEKDLDIAVNYFLQAEEYEDEPRVYKYLSNIHYSHQVSNLLLPNIDDAIKYQDLYIQHCCDKNTDLEQYVDKKYLYFKYLKTGLLHQRCFEVYKEIYPLLKDRRKIIEMKFDSIELFFDENYYEEEDLDNIDKMKDIIYKLNDEEDIAAYLIRGDYLKMRYYYHEGDYEEVLKLAKVHKDYLEMKKYINQVSFMFDMCSLLGKLYEENNNNEKAIFYYTNALVFSYLDRTVDKYGEATVLSYLVSLLDIKDSYRENRDALCDIANKDPYRFGKDYAKILSMSENVFDKIKALYIYECLSARENELFTQEKILLYDRIIGFFYEHRDFVFSNYDGHYSKFDVAAVKYLANEGNIILTCLKHELFLRCLNDETDPFIPGKISFIMIYKPNYDIENDLIDYRIDDNPSLINSTTLLDIPIFDSYIGFEEK